MAPPVTEVTRWLQSSVRWSDRTDAEWMCAKHLGPQMQSAVDDGILDCWFFIRKSPWWRLRYSPAQGVSLERVRRRISAFLTGLESESRISEYVHQVYEPETTAFGGATAMDIAHRLFSRDTAAVADYLALTAPAPGSDRRRELSLLLCTALARAAGQEWFEQGDIWSRLAALRGGTSTVIPTHPDKSAETVRRFLVADPETTAGRLNGNQAGLALKWIAAFRAAGTELRSIADQGQLERGLRAVLAHHILFHWNRLGLPLPDQQHLARAAQTAVFTDHHPVNPGNAIRQEGPSRHE
ncbi:thiopeptide-type bacteriocin biosynthesis protein [Glycomyces tenuis]|uniref:thiopeptide-type bacteriocin biosynthesis protein n=1 Tax=Glycomyces tenuis TaxID=58116 RepID=UPI0009DB8229|nr:thiopeptide-type bacteriocin biosynthesis protein [Glycomyces tenuis]